MTKSANPRSSWGSSMVDFPRLCFRLEEVGGVAYEIQIALGAMGNLHGKPPCKTSTQISSGSLPASAIDSQQQAEWIEMLCTFPVWCPFFFFVLKGVRLNPWNHTLLKSPFTTYGIFYGDRRWVISYNYNLIQQLGVHGAYPRPTAILILRALHHMFSDPKYDHAIEHLQNGRLS